MKTLFHLLLDYLIITLIRAFFVLLLWNNVVIDIINNINSITLMHSWGLIFIIDILFNFNINFKTTIKENDQN